MISTRRIDSSPDIIQGGSAIDILRTSSITNVYRRNSADDILRAANTNTNQRPDSINYNHSEEQIRLNLERIQAQERQDQFYRIIRMIVIYCSCIFILGLFWYFIITADPRVEVIVPCAIGTVIIVVGYFLLRQWYLAREQEQLRERTERQQRVLGAINYIQRSRGQWMMQSHDQLKKKTTDGLTNEQIEKLQRIRFSAETKSQILHEDLESSAADCPICLDAYNDNDDVLLLPCKHHYHYDCAVNWLTSNNSCPLCKAVVVPNHKNLGVRVETTFDAINNGNSNISVGTGTSFGSLSSVGSASAQNRNGYTTLAPGTQTTAEPSSSGGGGYVTSFDAINNANSNKRVTTFDAINNGNSNIVRNTVTNNTSTNANASMNSSFANDNDDDNNNNSIDDVKITIGNSAKLNLQRKIDI